MTTTGDGTVRGRIVAAVDIGSNSVHLLVARVRADEVDPLVDESVFLGLGDRVDHAEYLGADVRAQLSNALAGYAATAAAHGATAIGFVGTEPLRRAGDANRLVLEVEAATGTPLAILDHSEEALLTLLGVTGGRAIEREIVLVDVGGGSSEVVVATADAPPRAIGLPLGSARLAARFVEHDPPQRAEIDAMRAEAAREVRRAPEAHADDLVAVGGTASNIRKAAGLEPATPVSRAALAAALDELLGAPAAIIAPRRGLRPQRARLLPAGIAILEALLDRYGAQQIVVVETGIREGLAIALARRGRRWRDCVRELVAGTG
ncbi:MAG: hypothetical protein ACJ77N_03610 [Chloroflexota bacterium]